MNMTKSSPSGKSLTTYQLALTALMAAVICILGPVSVPIPISEVPISLGSFAVYLTLMILGTKLGTLSVVIYLLLGLAGLPVFSGYAGGVGKLLGATGGYLIGYLFVTLIGGLFADKFQGTGWKKWGLQLVGLLLGTAVLYLFGSLWLAKVAGMNLMAALWVGSIPYIPLDIVKMIVAILLGSTVRARLRQAGLFAASRAES